MTHGAGNHGFENRRVEHRHGTGHTGHTGHTAAHGGEKPATRHIFQVRTDKKRRLHRAEEYICGSAQTHRPPQLLPGNRNPTDKRLDYTLSAKTASSFAILLRESVMSIYRYDALGMHMPVINRF